MFNESKIKQKTRIDKSLHAFFFLIALLCGSIVLFIALFIFINGIKPFLQTYIIKDQPYHIDFFLFLTGKTWFKSPNQYGAGFIIVNTLYVTLLSLVLAIPTSILTALFIAKIAPSWLSKILNQIVELLASIPSIIYGLFGSGVITGLVKKLSLLFGYQSAGGLSTLSTALILAIMIIPTITMLSTTAIKAVKEEMIAGSLALGASVSQTNFKIVLTSAKSGIVSAIILGIGRAIGEATAVSMVCGNAGSGPTFNLFATTRTLTSTMLFNIHETTGVDYDIRFSIGVILILIILLTNLCLNYFKKRIGYHEK